MAQAHWQPLMDYMSQEIGRTVEFKTVADYTAVIEALKYGHADLARLGPSGYVLAEEEVDLVSIASIANDDGSLMTYQSYIVTRPGLTTLEGATFAYVDVGSTSGYLLSMLALIQPLWRLSRMVPWMRVLPMMLVGGQL